MTALTPARVRVDTTRMSIDELEALDRAYFAHLHDKAVEDTRRAIQQRQENHAPTDALERQLTRLLAQ